MLLYALILILHTHYTISTHATVPEFIIEPIISVNESAPNVKICVSTSSPLDRNIVVTAVTGMKNGATNQATGNAHECEI